MLTTHVAIYKYTDIMSGNDECLLLAAKNHTNMGLSEK